MLERRAAPRVAVDIPVLVARSPEQPLPGAVAVDVSRTGILVRFPEGSVPLRTGDPVLLSLVLPDGRMHRLGEVRRNLRGTDDRSYLAAQFTSSNGDDEERLLAFIADRATRLAPEADARRVESRSRHPSAQSQWAHGRVPSRP